MGWSSWNAFYCNVNEDNVKQNADLVVKMGLRDLGYNQINVDDCWNTVNRSAAGKLVADPKSFKSGIPSLANYVHKQQMKLGLYTSQTAKTCAGRAGAFGHEASDAAQYCDWDVDYLKVDLCGGEKYDAVNQSWIAFQRAFAKCSSPTVLSVEYCGPDHHDGPTPLAGCGRWVASLVDLWRTSSDLQPMWDSMYSSAAANAAMVTVARPGHYNDHDMLQAQRP